MLVLASQSPRRRELLTAAGIPFTTRAVEVPESPQPGESPQAYVRRLARSKAEAVPRLDGEIVLGADTVVVINGSILEKPSSEADARRMLHSLSGREHEVLTGITLLHSQGAVEDIALTRVRFAKLTSAEIDAYVAGGEPMDKAGAYGIQGIASRFVESIEGCYFNVVGLPVSLVARHLKQIQAKT